MAASSKTSTRSAGPSITPEEALEILQDAVRKCQQAGIGAGLSTYDLDDVRCVVIVLPGVDLADNDLVLLH
jgi:hypothetical protein